MKYKIFIILLVLAFLIGCKQPAQLTEPVVETTEPSEAVEEKTVEVTPQEQIVAETEGFKCDLNVPEQNLRKIKIDNVTRTTDSLIYYVLFFDDKSDIITLSGSFSVKVFSTTAINEQRIAGDYNLYSKTVGIDKSEFKNCRLGPLIITNSKLRASENYRFIDPSDYGMLRVEFKRTGSSDIFKDEYWPTSKADSVFP